MKQPKYKIGDRVFHITPESDRGVVINARYELVSNVWEFQVAFSAIMESLWYFEHELIDHKVFN